MKVQEVVAGWERGDSRTRGDAKAAWLLSPWAVLPKMCTPEVTVSLSGSSTEEHTRSCGWKGTRVSRRTLYSFVSSDFDLTMACDALSTRY